MIPSTPNCRCYLVIREPPPAIEEMDRKFQAKCLLLDNQPRLLIPTREEWIGLHLPERDDQLQRRN